MKKTTLLFNFIIYSLFSFSQDCILPFTTSHKVQIIVKDKISKTVIKDAYVKIFNQIGEGYNTNVLGIANVNLCPAKTNSFVRVSAEGYHVLYEDISLSNSNLNHKKELFITPNHEYYTLQVNVSNNHKPVVGATVRIIKADGTPDTLTNEKGVATFEKVKSKEVITIEVTDKKHGKEFHYSYNNGERAKVKETIKLRKSHFETWIKVTDIKNNPLSNAKVIFPYLKIGKDSVLTASTDKVGIVRFPSLAIGDEIVEVSKFGFLPKTAKITIKKPKKIEGDSTKKNIERIPIELLQQPTPDSLLVKGTINIHERINNLKNVKISFTTEGEEYLVALQENNKFELPKIPCKTLAPDYQFDLKVQHSHYQKYVEEGILLSHKDFIANKKEIKIDLPEYLRTHDELEMYSNYPILDLSYLKKVEFLLQDGSFRLGKKNEDYSLQQKSGKSYLILKTPLNWYALYLYVETPKHQVNKKFKRRKVQKKPEIKLKKRKS